MSPSDSAPPEPPKRKTVTKDIARIAGVAVFFAIVAWVLQMPSVERVVSVSSIREAVQDRGTEGLLLFGLLAAGSHGIGVPRLWACAVAGAIYGATTGALVAWVGTVLGAVLNFMMGRWVLRGPVKRRMPVRLRPWFKRFAQSGFRWSFYVRLFPLSNATVMNLVCGASRMRFVEFLAGTALGYLPFTVAFALFGSAAAKQKLWQIVLGAGCFAAVLLGRWLWKRLRAGAEDPVLEAAYGADSPAEAASDSSDPTEDEEAEPPR